MGGGRTGHGCGREPPQLLADKAALAARQGLRGLPTAPTLGGAEGGLQGGSARKTFQFGTFVWEPAPLGGGRTGHGCGRQPLQVWADKAALAARPGLQGLPTAPILGGAEGGLQGGSATKAFVPPNYGGEGG